MRNIFSQVPSPKRISRKSPPRSNHSESGTNWATAVTSTDTELLGRFPTSLEGSARSTRWAAANSRPNSSKEDIVIFLS